MTEKQSGIPTKKKSLSSSFCIMACITAYSLFSYPEMIARLENDFLDLCVFTLQVMSRFDPANGPAFAPNQ